MSELSSPAPTPSSYEEFVRLFVAHEGRLRSFLRALLPSRADVDEVIQETSLIAWEKFDRFERGTSFMAWSATIARYEALNYLRQRKRDPLIFSDAVMDLITQESADEDETLESERYALEHCLTKLQSTERELLLLSYRPGAKFHEVAAQAGRSVQGYYKTLQRLRAKLLVCIQRRLKEETA